MAENHITLEHTTTEKKRLTGPALDVSFEAEENGLHRPLPVTSTYQAGIGRTTMSKLAVNTHVSMESSATSSTTQD